MARLAALVAEIVVMGMVVATEEGLWGGGGDSGDGGGGGGGVRFSAGSFNFRRT